MVKIKPNNFSANSQGTPMFIVTSFPQRFKDFFESIAKNLAKDASTRDYLWRFVLALACLEGRVSLTKITAFTGEWRTRQSIVRFLEGDWNEREVLLESAMTTLRLLGWKPGKPLYLALDDTQIQKRASVMEGVSKMFLHAEKRYANGHDVILASIVYRGIAIPYAARLWTSKEACKKLQQAGQSIKFRKMTELAADCVRSFPDVSSKVTVLFDSFYLCKEVIDACKEKGFFYLGPVKSNRLIKESKNAKKNKSKQVGSYSTGYLAEHGRLFTIEGSKVKHRIAGRICYLVKAGTVKIVFCRRQGDDKIVALATNDRECGIKKVVNTYRNRWQIEVLFKSAKQNLGMGDYQFLSRRAVETYLRLVMVSHTFLTHLAYKELNEKRSEDAKKPICLAGISKTREHLRNMLLLDELNTIQPKPKSKGTYRFMEEIRTKIAKALIGKECFVNLLENISC